VKRALLLLLLAASGAILVKGPMLLRCYRDGIDPKKIILLGHSWGSALGVHVLKGVSEPMQLHFFQPSAA
jgi:predicted esterase